MRELIPGEEYNSTDTYHINDIECVVAIMED